MKTYLKGLLVIIFVTLWVNQAFSPATDTAGGICYGDGWCGPDIGGAKPVRFYNDSTLMIVPRSGQPDTLREAGLYYDEDDHKLKYYNGTTIKIIATE